MHHNLSGMQEFSSNMQCIGCAVKQYAMNDLLFSNFLTVGWWTIKFFVCVFF